MARPVNISQIQEYCGFGELAEVIADLLGYEILDGGWLFEKEVTVERVARDAKASVETVRRAAELLDLQEGANGVLFKSKRGTSNTGSKLKDDEVREIRQLIKAKYKHAYIAEKFNVHPNTIGKIARDESWSHLK